MRTAIVVAVLFLMAGCRENTGDVVVGVHGDHVTCASPASTGYDVYVPRATQFKIGDACPAGEIR